MNHKDRFLFIINMGVFSWKKIKEGAKTLGHNAAKFAGKLNTLYKTFKPLIDPALDSVTYGVGSKILSGASAAIDMFQNRDDLSETQRHDLLEQGVDVLKDGIGQIFSKLSSAPVVNVDDRDSGVINARRHKPVFNDVPLRQLRN